jgi:hypothetical protein
MPAWLTVAVGIAGSFVGAAVVVAFVGIPETAGEAYTVMWATIGTAVAASAGIVAAYRHFVQKRPIVGRDAHRIPERGIGVKRARRLLGMDFCARRAAGGRRNRAAPKAR